MALISDRFLLSVVAGQPINDHMPRRVRKSSSILAPAGNLIRRLSDTRARSRRRLLKYGLWSVVIFLVYSFMSGTYGIPRIVRLELEQKAITQANHDLRVNLIEADRVRYMLKHDRSYIEQVARTRYHMARPNETVYRYSGQ